jgi:fibronectin type 3 domain-containing protein
MKKTVLLNWGNCSSPDHEETLLKRRLKGEINWQSIAVFPDDNNNYQTYTDSTVESRKKYEYTLVATDAFGLQSLGNKILEIQAIDIGKQFEIENFSVKLNKRKHTVKLRWDYPYSGVDRFLIYRTLNGGTKTIITSTPANVHEYYDENTGQGNTYGYQVKVIHKDGGESSLTEEIFIEY